MTIKISRKKFIQLSGLVTADLLTSPAKAGFGLNKPKIKAIAFDGFPIFDPRPIFQTVQALFPEKGKQLADAWFTKQFAYQWLRATAHRYKDFWEVAKDALEAAADQCSIRLTDRDKALIMT